MNLSNLELLFPGGGVPVDSWRWGVVSGVGQVVLAGDDVPIFVTDSLADCRVGDRVLVRLHGSRAVIVGVSGGIDLSVFDELVSRDELGEVVAGKVDRSELNDYATKTEVSRKADKSALNSYATKTELDRKLDKSALAPYTTVHQLGDASIRMGTQTLIKPTPSAPATWYTTTGTVSMPSFQWAYTANNGHINAGTINVRIPYTPPNGWTFTWEIAETTGFTFLSVADRIPRNGVQRCRILQIGATAVSHPRRLLWRLVKL